MLLWAWFVDLKLREAGLAHEKHVQIVGNSKIYFTILIIFISMLLRCDAWQHARVPNSPLGTCEFKFASKAAFLRCL